METIYLCERCGERVEPGDGYIHSRKIGQWHIHHRACADFTADVCFEVPRHWTHLLDAHVDLSVRVSAHV